MWIDKQIQRYLCRPGPCGIVSPGVNTRGGWLCGYLVTDNSEAKGFHYSFSDMARVHQTQPCGWEKSPCRSVICTPVRTTRLWLGYFREFYSMHEKYSRKLTKFRLVMSILHYTTTAPRNSRIFCVSKSNRVQICIYCYVTLHLCHRD